MECKQCGKCCQHPCALEPNDLEKISDYLNITIEELIDKYLILDYWMTTEESLYYFTPKRVGDNGTKIASFSWAFSDKSCMFLENNLCKIHDVKPRGGREWICGMEEEPYSKHEAGMLWKGNKYLEVGK